MHAASLNHIFRLVWSDRLATYVAVAECACGRGKSTRGSGVRAAAAALGLMAAVAAQAAASLPTGANVAQGSATLTQAGNTLTVRQDTPRLITNWQSFDIAAGSTVQFVQPSAASVALNRVVGSDVSSIQGALLANGQVFLVNPNGVLFSPSARVDVGGLVASTLALSDHDFMAGRYRFEGASTASVTNAGSLRASEGGTVALIAARVVNTGSIEAQRGSALLASGSVVTLDVGGSTQLQVSQGVLDGLVDNGGAIRADGGHVLLTARALDQLSRSVVNNTGLVRARTLADGQKGEIVLLGDMASGTLNAAGQLDASAPAGGDGGFIETSAAYVNTTALRVDAGATAGQGGQWLIDPFDYTINGAAAATIAGALDGGTSVTVTTQANTSALGATASGSGDITVASPISKTAGGNATLTLRADRNVIVNSAITSTTGQLGITLSAANNTASAVGGVAVNANLSSNGGRILIGGAGGSTTAAQADGIGYALNSGASLPALKIGTNTTISSGGGHIVVNGHTTATSPSYDGTKAGIYVLSGATLDSGGGNLYLNAVSAGDAQVFAFGVEGNSGTVTTFRSGAASGGIVVEVNNTQNVLGSLGLVNNGNQARIQFWAPSVAHMLFRLNGNNQAAQFTQSPPCNAGYPNCGTMVIPGGNNSYTSAGYNVVNMAMYPIYVFTGSASRVYDGSTATTGLPSPTTLGGPGGFTVGALGPLVFNAPSKNADAYSSLVSSPANPSSHQSGTYAVAYFNQGTYTITPKALNTFSAANKPYDGTTAAAVTSSGLVSGDAVTIQATGSFAQAAAADGVAVQITGVALTGADAGNYSLGAFGAINTTADITPAPLTVMANTTSKTYDGLAFNGHNGVTYSGFVNGEGAGALAGTLGYGGTAQGAVNAGSYLITPQGLTSSNYAISFASGALTVNPATLTLTASPASRSYGAANPTFTGTVAGLVGSDTLASATTGTLSFATSATATSGVGSHAITGTGLTAHLGNYVLAQAGGNASALTVTPAALTITANATGKTYDATGFSGGNGVAYSGFVNGEGPGALAGTLGYGGTSQGAVNAGSYLITPQGLSSSNYAISFIPGGLTVNPAPLTAVAGGLTGNTSKIYDGSTTATLSPGNYLLSGFFGSDGATVTRSAGSYADKNVGRDKPVSVSLASSDFVPSGATRLANYVLPTAATGAIGTITPAPLVITAAAASKVYDGNTTAPGSPAVSGLVAGDTIGGLLQAFDDKHAGSGKAVTVLPGWSISDGLGGGNYNVVTVASAGGSIARRAASVAASPASVTYNGSLQIQPAPQATGFLAGDDVQFGGAASGRNAGNHLSQLQATGADVANYAVSFGNAALTIERAPLTLTSMATSKFYDGTTLSSATPMTAGLVAGDTLSLLTQAYLDKDVGTGKTVTVTGYALSDGNGGANYAVSTVANTSSVVNPAVLTITATPAAQVQGRPAVELMGAVSGFVNNETAATALTGTLVFQPVAAGSATLPGIHAVQGTGLSAVAGNYVFVQAPGNLQALNVTAAPVQVNVDSIVRSPAAVPNFPDNARPALGLDRVSMSDGSLNYVSLSQPAPTGLLGSFTALAGSALPTTPSPAGTLVAAAAPPPGAATTLATEAGIPGAAGSLQDVNANAEISIPAMPLGGLAQAPGRFGSAAVPTAGARTGASSGGAPQGTPLTTGTDATSSPDSAGPAPTRAAVAGTAQRTVSSANGPLDVFVIDGGVNLDRGTGKPAR